MEEAECSKCGKLTIVANLLDCLVCEIADQPCRDLCADCHAAHKESHTEEEVNLAWEKAVA